MPTKEELENQVDELTNRLNGLKAIIEERETQIDELAAKLEAVEKTAEDQAIDLDDKNFKLEEAQTQYENLKKTYDELAEKAEKQDNLIDNLPPGAKPLPVIPVENRKMVRYVCIKECFRRVSPQPGAASKTFKEGDSLLWPEGEPAPGFFRRADSAEEQAAIDRDMKEKDRKALPPFVQKAVENRAVTHGG